MSFALIAVVLAAIGSTELAARAHVACAALLRRYGAMGRRFAFVVLLASGCATDRVPYVATPEVNGAAMLIDLSPSNRPAMVGALDFELLAPGAGKACVDRGSSKQYWIGMAALSKVTNDALTQQAIAAATTDALGRLDEVDAILLTRVITESKGPDRICATIVGRGVRLTKAVAPTGSGS